MDPHTGGSFHTAGSNYWGILVLTGTWIYLTLQGHAGQRVQRLLLAFLTLLFISICITGYLGGELVHFWNI